MSDSAYSQGIPDLGQRVRGLEIVEPARGAVIQAPMYNGLKQARGQFGDAQVEYLGRSNVDRPIHGEETIELANPRPKVGDRGQSDLPGVGRDMTRERKVGRDSTGVESLECLAIRFKECTDAFRAISWRQLVCTR